MFVVAVRSLDQRQKESTTQVDASLKDSHDNLFEGSEIRVRKL